LDSGSLVIRLEFTDANMNDMELECRTMAFARGAAELLERGLTAVGEVESLDGRTCQRFRGPHGFIVQLSEVRASGTFRAPIVIPTNLEWVDSAEALLDAILGAVPGNFRDQAVRQAAERAEYLAAAQGEVIVDLSTAVQAVIETTPAFKLDALRAALRERQLDPALWSASFER
jgi:hypothetical protein